MSSVLVPLPTTPSDPAAQPVRPVRQRKKTPKAAALSKTPVVTTPAPEPESVAVDSPMDRLLAMVDQAIPEEHPVMTNENASPGTAQLDLVKTTTPKPKRQYKKRAATTLPNESNGTAVVDASPTTPKIAKMATMSTPNPEAALNDDGTSPASEQKKKRKAPLIHADSVCSNCGTTETTLWRRSEEGSIECNSCSLYFKKKGVKRPQALANREIYRRKNRKSVKYTEESADAEKVAEKLVAQMTSSMTASPSDYYGDLPPLMIVEEFEDE